jgi:hypothetical protein
MSLPVTFAVARIITARLMAYSASRSFTALARKM